MAPLSGCQTPEGASYMVCYTSKHKGKPIPRPLPPPREKILKKVFMIYFHISLLKQNEMNNVLLGAAERARQIAAPGGPGQGYTDILRGVRMGNPDPNIEGQGP